MGAVRPGEIEVADLLNVTVIDRQDFNEVAERISIRGNQRPLLPETDTKWRYQRRPGTRWDGLRHGADQYPEAPLLS